MRKLIIFLIRKRLGVKKCQAFKFTNQCAPMNWYIFDLNGILWKVEYHHNNTLQILKRSRVSLNWLMDNECEIEICPDQAYCRMLLDILLAKQRTFE